jgi:chloramphenicol O-acetyltransferase type B
MAGVNIGDGAVIAAQLERSPMSPYAVVGGVLAALIRYRFRENHRAAKLRVNWWEPSRQPSGLPFRDVERCLT